MILIKVQFPLRTRVSARKRSLKKMLLNYSGLPAAAAAAVVVAMEKAYYAQFMVAIVSNVKQRHQGKRDTCLMFPSIRTRQVLPAGAVIALSAVRASCAL